LLPPRGGGVHFQGDRGDDGHRHLDLARSAQGGAGPHRRGARRARPRRRSAMTSQPSRDALRGSEALAKVLREHPPALDDLARARMEKRLLAADRSPARGAPRRSGRALIAAGGALALAAALVLAVLAAREEPTAPVARFERRE